MSLLSSQTPNNPLAVILAGAGAVGSYLADSLLAQDCRVVCFDQPSPLKENNIAHLVGNRNFEMVEKLPDNFGEVDYVFCLDAKWFDYLDNNQLQNARWLFLGSKFSDMVFDKAQELGVNCRFVCADGVFGPRMNLDSDSWTAKLISDVFFRRRIRLAGDGSSLVYPLFVKDLTTGLTSALFMPQSEGRVFYFAGEEITLFSFAKLWSDQVGQVKIEFDEQKNSPTINYQREIELSGKELGWKVNFSSSEAVEITMNWLNRPDVSRLLSSAGVVSDETTIKPADKPDKLTPDEQISDLEKASFVAPSLGKSKDDSKRNLKTPNEGLWLSRSPQDQPKEDRELLIHKINISRLLQDSRLPQTNLPSQSSPKKPQLVSKNKHRFGLILLVLFLFLSPFLFLVKDLAWAFINLNKSQESCLSGQLSFCRKQAESAQSHFYLAKNTIEKLTPILLPLVGHNNLSEIVKMAVLGQEAAEALSYFSDSAYQLNRVFGAVINPEAEKEANFSSLIETSEQTAQRAYFKLTNVSATGKSLSGSFAKQALSQLPAIVEATKLTLDSLPFLANFLSHDEQKIILLLQNNMELRPTGGFIGSLALMNFSSGRLVDFTVKDVYEADGQLKGQVDPPQDLKEYLGEETWYLRDSNWSPDFPTTARQVLWFWQKQLDQDADAVVAINLRVAQEILSALGEIYLPDYQEKITAQNLFERAEYHSEVGFFPGSTQKKDFLGSLVFEILAVLKRENNLPVSLLTAFQQSFLEGEIMMYFTDPKLEGQVMALGFDGGIKEAVCQKESCLSSYLWAIDTNIGANKANFFVKKRLIQRLGVSDTQVNHSLRLTWQNTAQTQSWPAGTYKNYWRLYVPGSAILQEAFLENNAGQRQAINLAVNQEMGKTVWSYLIEVPINSQVTLEINYQIKNQFSKGRKRLIFLIQKQAGSVWDEDVTLVSYPANWLPLIVSPETDIASGAITYRNVLNQDRLFEFEWGEP
ncbi:MAG: DUF4012 domain-containing protein [Candidatus Shapirobacteria bacterium]|nr:DUF4012 domain-containing protein [Candidatus Shapirobacteria bacterium]MDD5481369.1 DUF4012 domain-containing protein [Candidatus Shapirobacteria bacterium]